MLVLALALDALMADTAARPPLHTAAPVGDQAGCLAADIKHSLTNFGVCQIRAGGGEEGGTLPGIV